MCSHEMDGVASGHEPCALDDIVWGVMEGMPTEVRRRLVHDLDELSATLLDRVQIERVIRTLISSVVACSPEDRPVQLFAFESDGAVKLSVVGDFRPNSPVPDLASCSNVVEAHGGMLELDSAETDITITLSLPMHGN